MVRTEGRGFGRQRGSSDGKRMDGPDGSQRVRTAEIGVRGNIHRVSRYLCFSCFDFSCCQPFVQTYAALSFAISDRVSRGFQEDMNGNLVAC